MTTGRAQKKDSIKLLVEAGHITTVRAIFEYTAPTPAAKHLGTSYGRLLKLVNKVGLFRVDELFKLAKYYNIDEEKMLVLMMNQRRDHNKKKK